MTRKAGIRRTALIALPAALGAAWAGAGPSAATTENDTPRWIAEASCTPSAATNTAAVEELTTQSTNFDVVDAFAQKLTAAEEGKTNSAFGGVYWGNPTDGLVIQVGGTGDGEAARLLSYAEQEAFPYPISFSRGLTLNQRETIAEDLLTDGIGGHTVSDASVTGMCNDVDVALETPPAGTAQTSKKTTSARSNDPDPADEAQLSKDASAKYRADIEVAGIAEANSNRRDESGAANGGGALRTSSRSIGVYGTPDCTSGFRAVRNSTVVMVTAGHCARTGDAWYSLGNSSYLGTTVYSGVYDNPGSNTRADAGAFAYGTGGYGTSIWYGGAYASDLRNVTAKGSYPTAGTPVWINGATSGRIPAKIANNSTTQWLGDGTISWQSPVAKVWYTSSVVAAGGDSGGPVVKGNEATSDTTDLKALGTDSGGGRDSNGDYYEVYTRVDTIENFGNLSISTS